MTKTHKNWLRRVVQIGVIALIAAFGLKLFGNQTFDCEAFCPFGGLETLSTYLVRGSMACSMTATQIMMGVVLGIGVILFSRLFCSYLCPLGTVGEGLSKLGAKLKVKEVSVKTGSTLDIVLRAVKYILLFTIFYFTINSSELFCKNFDPYYATATAFKGEITLWMVCISIALFIIGNFFIKMFWCKYICPLGAASNIFKFTIMFVVVFGAYLGLNYIGTEMSWVWPLTAVCLFGYLLEVLCRESKVFPVLKVCRDTEACNNCGLCAKKCPYSINVNQVVKVKNVDCTLCGECVNACNKNALSISGMKSPVNKIVPVVIVAVLFAAGAYFGSTVELPTIDERWGTEEQQKNLEKLTVEGLRSVKCYGSSKAFSAKVQKIKGAYGVATFVKHGRVNIYYNPAETTPEIIQQAIYTPSKFKISQPTQADSLIKVITIRTEKMYDKMDPNYLGLQIRQSNRKYFGLESEYACPLIVRLYMALDEPIDEAFYKDMVEMKVLEMPVHGGGTKEIKVDFKYMGLENQIDTITRRAFLERQFNFLERKFTTNIEKLGLEHKDSLDVVYPALDKPIITRNIPYLSSYLSLQNGMLGMKTLINDKEEYAFRFFFDNTVLTPDKLIEILKAPQWTIKKQDGTTEATDPKFVVIEENN